MNPMISLKTYWSILKTLLNKILCIPPLLQGNKYVKDFKKEAELFNFFFAQQYSIIDNSSELPSNFLKKIDKSISAITFTCDDIATLIKDLVPNKGHGHDMISICMFKPCGKSICKPLDLIYQSCIKQGKFSTEWKKLNVVPVHKKGFKPDDSCVNQLISITEEIYQSFDVGREVIFKDFDKVWHKGLIHKLKQNGVKRNLLETLTNFSNDRKQRLVLNGKH